jgi:hypothetical protein
MLLGALAREAALDTSHEEISQYRNSSDNEEEKIDR